MCADGEKRSFLVFYRLIVMLLDNGPLSHAIADMLQRCVHSDRPHAYIFHVMEAARQRVEEETEPRDKYHLLFFCLNPSRQAQHIQLNKSFGIFTLPVCEGGPVHKISLI